MSANDDFKPIGALQSGMRLVGFAAALAATYIVLILNHAGQLLDSRFFGPQAMPEKIVYLTNVYRVGVPVVLILACVSFGIVALVQRRFVDLIRAALIVVLSLLVTEVLKLVLPRPEFGVHGYSQNTFPSGHTAVSVSAVVALVVLVPPHRLRPAVLAFAAILAVAAPWASVASFAHRPSDVIGGALVVGLVTSGVCYRYRSVAGRQPWVLIAQAGAAVGGAIFIALPSADSTDVLANRLAGGPGWFLLSGAIAGLAMAVAPSSGPADGAARERSAR